MAMSVVNNTNNLKALRMIGLPLMSIVNIAICASWQYRGTMKAEIESIPYSYQITSIIIYNAQ